MEEAPDPFASSKAVEYDKYDHSTPLTDVALPQRDCRASGLSFRKTELLPLQYCV